jgi:predicted O-methyltransferase YrrM
MVVNWHMGDEGLTLLKKWLEENHPINILEIGSGKSSVLFYEYTKKYNTQYLSLEHSTEWYKHTLELGVKEAVRLCPLKEYEHGFFYNCKLPNGIDFVLIDAPPLSYGRNAVLYMIYPYLTKNCVLWLDDCDREHERECLKNWQRDFDITVTDINGRIKQIEIKNDTKV